MAKTTINIPKMDAAIVCRNERERTAARVFVNDMVDIASAAVKGYRYGLAAVDAVSGSAHWLFEELHGTAAAFFHMEMLQPHEPISSVELADAVRAIYLDMMDAAGNTPADDEDTAAAVYMDAVKADAAYCLGIDEGSDEWYALADI